jgi:membrane-bound lytic murein transglycosylase D
MKHTGNAFFPRINSNLDLRANPYTATLGALHLLRQNHSILKSWELAIPAYNFGVGQIIKAKRSLKKENLSLDYLFKHYESSSLGFASKNYYANFLAASVLLKNFSKFKMPSYKESKTSISFYLTKCSLRPRTFFSLFNNPSRIKSLNTHILNTRKTYKKGLLIVSDQNLTSKKYFKLSKKHLTKYYPKNFYKIVRKMSCSN